MGCDGVPGVRLAIQHAKARKRLFLRLLVMAKLTLYKRKKRENTMHPYLFGKIPSYSVMMIIGILAAVVLFRVLCKKKQVPGKIYDYYATAAIVAIAAA